MNSTTHGSSGSDTGQATDPGPTLPTPGKEVLRRRAVLDLALIAAVTVGFFVLAGQWEISERIARWGYGREHWQADELPLTLLVLSLSLVVFAWRRWRELAIEVKARRAAELANQRMLARNRQLAQQLITLQEQERQHLARELHDELGQCCVAIRFDAASILRDTQDALPEAHVCARAIQQTADHLHEVVRSMLHRLRPAALDELGLEPGLRALTASWAARHGVACSFDTEGSFEELGEAGRIAIYRTVQESLTNIARHAQARRAAVTLRRRMAADATDDGIAVCIDDDGVGMAETSGGAGLGILGMTERLEALGGQLSIARSPMGGTRVEAVMPVPAGSGTTP